MATKLTRLTHKIVIQLHLVAESCIIYGYHAKRPVRKLLDTHSYFRFISCHNYFAGKYELGAFAGASPIGRRV